MKKIITLLLLLLLIPLVQADEGLVFSDMTSSDPDYELVTNFNKRGLFSGINGEANLDAPLMKAHGVMLAMKLVDKEPDLALAQKMGLISAIPTADQSLSKAEWMVILSRAFKIPLEVQPGQAWYDPAFKLGQNLKVLTQEDDPYSPVDRRLALRSAYKFESVFKVQIQQGIVVKVEEDLMNIRNGLLDPAKTAIEAEKDIWGSIIKLKDVDPAIVPVARLEALRAYQMALLILHQMRFSPSSELLPLRQTWIAAQLKKAVQYLPPSEGFGADLRHMSGLTSSEEVPAVYELLSE
ncbi:MAG TPA: hypothetical protein VIT68_03000 [Candidatus Gracilibacteria bacterium]